MIGPMRLVLAGLAMLACVTSAVIGVSAEAASPPAEAERRVVREVTLPAGTVLRVRVSRGFGSDISTVEDPVQGTLVHPVLAGGAEALPTGSTLTGYVSSAVRPGRVKGRGRVSVRFTELRRADGGEHYAIRTGPGSPWRQPRRRRMHSRSAHRRRAARLLVGSLAARRAQALVRWRAAAAAPRSCSPRAARTSASAAAPRLRCAFLRRSRSA
jgi:hypothetical protein